MTLRRSQDYPEQDICICAIVNTSTPENKCSYIPGNSVRKTITRVSWIDHKAQWHSHRINSGRSTPCGLRVL